MKKYIFLLLFAAVILPKIGLSNATIKPLIETAEMDSLLETIKPVIIDLRPSEDYKSGHIPNSINLPYGKSGWRAKINNIPGQLPPKEKLQKLLRSAGVNQDSTVIVIYGAVLNSDFGSAARVYWTIKTAGIKNISILNGGYKAWFEDLYETTYQPFTPVPGNITIAAFDKSNYSDLKDVKENIQSKKYLMVDARPKAQYDGYEKHKASKAGGTIPSAKQISQFAFLTEKTAKLKPVDELKEISEQLPLDEYEGIISFCNTGHWAATNWFILSELLNKKTKMYDGSMVEWTSNENRPLENSKNAFQLLYYKLFAKK